MKKIASFLIGFMIMLSGMHIMPANAMEGEMGHCSMCTEEDRLAGNCKPASTSKKESFKDLFPLGQNCDCDFEKNSKGHHNAVLLGKTDPSKFKTVYSGLTKPITENILSETTFLTSQKINAPPHAYMEGFRTVQQLK